MKKILLTLVLLILFIPGVKADVDDACTLVASYSSTEYKFIKSTKFPYYYLNTNAAVVATFPIKKNLYYTFYFDDADIINLNNYLFDFSGGDQLQITKNDYYYFFKLGNYQVEYNANIFSSIELLEEWNNIYVYSSEIETACLPLPKEEPEEPTPIPGDTTLDTFYFLYLDKLKSLADYTLENKFLLATIGIILLFAILELILYLFNKGGYRR